MLEDCDLVAEDRSFTPYGNPLLFTVLDEMDGLGSDIDACFLLTTNRVDLLEPALAQRPGRVDLAVEIPLPDTDGRHRLLDLYGRGIYLAASDAELVVERTAGVPASFVKEMTRRATLIAAERGSPSTEATDVHTAVDELMTANETLTRRLLGTNEGGEGDWPSTDEQVVSRPRGSRGWFAYSPHPSRLPLDG